METPREYYYTYAYLREDGTPYYIGKGKGDRAYSKHQRGKSKGGYFTPPEKNKILILKQNLTEEEAFKHEIYMIAVLGRKDLGTGILRNLTDGGEGVSGYRHSDETKMFIKEVGKGRKHSDKTKKKISIGNKGKKQTEETKKKIGDANRLYLKDGLEYKEAQKRYDKNFRENMSEERKKQLKEYKKEYYLKNKNKWKNY
jgi:hypothetical protein